MKPSTIYAIEGFVHDLMQAEEIEQLVIERALKSNGLRIVPEASACDERDHEEAVGKAFANGVYTLSADAEDQAEKMRPLGETDTLLAISISTLRGLVEGMLE